MLNFAHTPRGNSAGASHPRHLSKPITFREADFRHFGSELQRGLWLETRKLRNVYLVLTASYLSAFKGKMAMRQPAAVIDNGTGYARAVLLRSYVINIMQIVCLTWS